MEEKYGAPVLPADCLNMTEEDIAEIITDVLYQFPVSRISLKLPGFIDGLIFRTISNRNLSQASGNGAKASNR